MQCILEKRGGVGVERERDRGGKGGEGISREERESLCIFLMWPQMRTGRLKVDVWGIR